VSAISPENRQLIDDWLGSVTSAAAEARAHLDLAHFTVAEVDTLMTLARDQGRREGILALRRPAARDPLPPARPTYEDARDLVIREQKASPSFIQRKLQVGYDQARAWIERMEADGYCTPANRAGVRIMKVGANWRQLT